MSPKLSALLVACDKANQAYERAKFDAEQALSRREFAWHSSVVAAERYERALVAEKKDSQNP